MIPNNFHFIYKENEYNDIKEYQFLCIYSCIEINKPNKIYFHYINLPNGDLWNIIKEKLILKKIIIPENYENNPFEYLSKFEKAFIYKTLIHYGGIYSDIHTIFINPIIFLLKYNFFKSKNDEIIGSEQQSYMGNKYLSFYLNNIEFKENFGKMALNDKIIENYLINNLNYNIENNYLEREIYDYSFGDYFHLIKNCFIFNFCNQDFLKYITFYNIFNKITIYNLLVRHIFTYKFINYSKINSINNINNIKLINYIDEIYWINLETSKKRRNNMMKILNLFEISNTRINAYDGNKEKNINEKYFYCNNNLYPKYSNKEYAILLSHLTAIETYISNININYGYALILEDDLSLDFINYWNKDFKTIIYEAPNDWDIIMLSYFSTNIYNEQDEYYIKWNNHWSALSYLINYKNIKNKILNFKIENKWKCEQNDLMVSDNYIFSKFNTYVYKYPYFTFPDDNDSTFHEDHLEYHRIYKNCNYITLEKISNQLYLHQE